jgi:hypothetical protein
MGRNDNSIKILVANHQGKEPLRRPRSRWDENIKIYLR